MRVLRRGTPGGASAKIISGLRAPQPLGLVIRGAHRPGIAYPIGIFGALSLGLCASFALRSFRAHTFALNFFAPSSLLYADPRLSPTVFFFDHFVSREGGGHSVSDFLMTYCVFPFSFLFLFQTTYTIFIIIYCFVFFYTLFSFNLFLLDRSLKLKFRITKSCILTERNTLLTF